MVNVKVESNTPYTSYSIGMNTYDGFNISIPENESRVAKAFGYYPGTTYENYTEADSIAPFYMHFKGITPVAENIPGVGMGTVNYPFNLDSCELLNPDDLPEDVIVNIVPSTFTMENPNTETMQTFNSFIAYVSGRFSIGDNLQITYKLNLDPPKTVNKLSEVYAVSGVITNLQKPRYPVLLPCDIKASAGNKTFTLTSHMPVTPKWGTPFQAGPPYP